MTNVIFLRNMVFTKNPQMGYEEVSSAMPPSSVLSVSSQSGDFEVSLLQF